VYRGYVRGIAIRRTKGCAWPLPSALLFRCRCSRHARDTNCRPDSRRGRIAPFRSKLHPEADYRRLFPATFWHGRARGRSSAGPFSRERSQRLVAASLSIDRTETDPVQGMMLVKDGVARIGWSIFSRPKCEAGLEVRCLMTLLTAPIDRLIAGSDKCDVVHGCCDSIPT